MRQLIAYRKSLIGTRIARKRHPHLYLAKNAVVQVAELAVPVDTPPLQTLRLARFLNLAGTECLNFNPNENVLTRRLVRPALRTHAVVRRFLIPPYSMVTGPSSMSSLAKLCSSYKPRKTTTWPNLRWLFDISLVELPRLLSSVFAPATRTLTRPTPSVTP